MKHFHVKQRILLAVLAIMLSQACSRQPAPAPVTPPPAPTTAPAEPPAAALTTPAPATATAKPAITAPPATPKTTPAPVVKATPDRTPEAALETPAPKPARTEPTPAATRATTVAPSPSPQPTPGPAAAPATPVVPTATPTTKATAQGPLATPSLRIISPADGSVLIQGDIMVSVRVANFKLVSKIGEANIAGEGHIIYYRDVDAPVNPAGPALSPSTSGGSMARAEDSFTWAVLSPGLHTFSAQLVNNDMTSLNPPVVAKVSVTVTAPPSPTEINITARNGAFSLQTIKVRPGADVAIIFENNDVLPHNIAIYDSKFRTNLIFRGAMVSPLEIVTYRFKAPANLGFYFFACDVHPDKMNGSFNVMETG